MKELEGRYKIYEDTCKKEKTEQRIHLAEQLQMQIKEQAEREKLIKSRPKSVGQRKLQPKDNGMTTARRILASPLSYY